MKKLLIISLIIGLLLPAMMHAGTKGTVTGRVVDTDGKGVPGASVKVVGTTQGTIVRNKDGNFTIVGIDAGTRQIQASFVGFDPVTKEVFVKADGLVEIEFVLGEGSVMTDEIIVTGKKLVDAQKQGSLESYGETEIMAQGSNSIIGVINMSAGVSAGTGISIRGSRTNETRVLIDGVDVTNKFTGSFGSVGSGFYPMISKYATEEVQMLKGGFSAEYGDVIGGIVNTSMKTGNSERYEGFLHYSSDLPALYGSRETAVEVVREGNDLKAIEAGEGLSINGSNRHQSEFGFGGPIPLLNNSTFYLTGNYNFWKHRSASFKHIDPLGNDWGKLDNNRSWVKNVEGRFKFNINQDINITLGGKYGLSSHELAGSGSLYMNDEGWVYDRVGDEFILQTDADGNPLTNGVEERLARINVLDNFVTMVMARIYHQLSPTSYYEFTVTNHTNLEENGRRIEVSEPGFFTGFEKYSPLDELKIQNDKLVPGRDRQVDYYSELIGNIVSEDGVAISGMPLRNPITGYYEGQSNATSTSNPWGLKNFFVEHGGGSFEFRQNNEWRVLGHFVKNWKFKEFRHFFKTGFETQLYELHRHYNGSPYTGNPFFDVYTDSKWGGNLYVNLEDASPERIDKINSPFKPYQFAYFIEDQVTYKGIIFTGGIRFDYFNSNSETRENYDEWIAVTDDEGFVDTDAKFNISPRLNVAYPITDLSNIRLSYGILFQTPQFQYLYDNFNRDDIRASPLIGNPDINPQKSAQYEVSYENAFTEGMMFGATVFYKDITNQLGVTYAPAVPDPFYFYEISEYGNVRGVELNLRKSINWNDPLGFDINYTFASNKTTSSGPTSNYGVTVDPYSDNITFPLAVYTAGGDITHTVKMNLFFSWADNRGPAIGGIKPLENTIINFSGFYRSGAPYTKTDVNGNPLSERNALRFPSYNVFSLRLTKSFMMKDIFGESAGNSIFEFYIDVSNLFNRTAVTSFYTSTGDPLDNGIFLNRKVGDFSSENWYDTREYENIESWRVNQYDNYGKRLYNEVADIDQDGVVTQAERYQKYIEYVDFALDTKGNFQYPRTVYFGFAFRF